VSVWQNTHIGLDTVMSNPVFLQDAIAVPSL
jgi:hypothetical protein